MARPSPWPRASRDTAMAAISATLGEYSLSAPHARISPLGPCTTMESVIAGGVISERREATHRVLAGREQEEAVRHRFAHHVRRRAHDVDPPDEARAAHLTNAAR